MMDRNIQKDFNYRSDNNYIFELLYLRFGALKHTFLWEKSRKSRVGTR